MEAAIPSRSVSVQLIETVHSESRGQLGKEQETRRNGDGPASWEHFPALPHTESVQGTRRFTLITVE